MSRNEGHFDRWTRICVGIFFIWLAALGDIGPWGYIGVVPLLTGLLAWCPLYTVIGFNTCDAPQ